MRGAQICSMSISILHIRLLNEVMGSVQSRVSDEIKDLVNKIYEKRVTNYISLRKVKAERDSLHGSVSQGKIQNCISVSPHTWSGRTYPTHSFR